MSLGILGLNEDFVQMNEVMTVLLNFHSKLCNSTFGKKNHHKLQSVWFIVVKTRLVLFFSKVDKGLSLIENFYFLAIEPPPQIFLPPICFTELCLSYATKSITPTFSL